MEYPVASRTLQKWSATRLNKVPAGRIPKACPPGSLGYTYVYEGSTCNNGGTAYTALLHVVVSESDGGWRIEDARIEIPEDRKEAASEMCAAPGKGPEEAASFFERLSKPAVFVGRSLEEVIRENMPENFAGCFCGRAQVNQKWKIALSTVHFALTSTAG